MTLAEAAAALGYREYSPLRKAARTGALRTERYGNVYVTKQEWLDEWVRTKQPKGWPKRTPRRPASLEQPQ